MLGFYLTVLLVVALIAYAGYEETFRLIYFIELRIKYAWVQVRLYFMKKSFERQMKKLGIQPTRSN
jgi:hypothetical protein|tara:strand:+ start:899 stop:1096 length:198 start_codon:yes stop_codon:yes gene_type:complete